MTLSMASAGAEADAGANAICQHDPLKGCRQHHSGCRGPCCVRLNCPRELESPVASTLYNHEFAPEAQPKPLSNRTLNQSLDSHHQSLDRDMLLISHSTLLRGQCGLPPLKTSQSSGPQNLMFIKNTTILKRTRSKIALQILQND